MKRILAIMALTLFAMPATADGLLSGYACGQMPGSYTVDVEVVDDSPRMLQIRDTAINALERKRAEISGSAELVLVIDTRFLREGVTRKQRDLGSVTDGSSEQIRARMNLWSNREDSLIGGRRDGIVEGGLDEVHVDITINDRSSGKCVWRGEAIHGSAGEDQWAIAEKTVLKLLNVVGKDVRDRNFEID